MYLETLNEVIPKAGRKLVIDDTIQGVVPLLGLEGGLPGVAAKPAPTGAGGGR
jgi:hypothetical protein